jgi:hypothetical protein
MAVVAACCLSSCSQTTEPAPVLGQAFVGPAALQIRKELGARSPLVATVNHGERLDLIGRRRRFYEVRTKNGAEGWVDGRQLLSSEAMEQLAALAKQTAGAPGQGHATVFDALNIHTEPNRQSPSFFQIGPGQHVDVVGYLRAPRIAFDPPELIPSTPAPDKRAQRPKKAPQYPPPPPARPPSVPRDWLALSGNPEGVLREKAVPAQEAPAVHLEDWTLVRNKEGRAGWALSRSLFMAVPDEVAQYAERARISAYFSIGTIEAKPESKKVWLWAALSPGTNDRDFDSLRIFSYNPRRQRYETAFIERGVRGWLPIIVSGESARSFRVVVQEKSGAIVEREYTLTNYRAKVTSRKPSKQPEPYWKLDQQGRGKPNPLAGPRRGDGWAGKAQDLIEGIKGRLKR